jgi:hypothetical protein
MVNMATPIQHAILPLFRRLIRRSLFVPLPVYASFNIPRQGNFVFPKSGSKTYAMDFECKGTNDENLLGIFQYLMKSQTENSPFRANFFKENRPEPV